MPMPTAAETLDDVISMNAARKAIHHMITEARIIARP